MGRGEDVLDGPGDEAGFAFAPESLPAAGEPGEPSRALTVLLVDDDVEFQRSLKLALANFEFQSHPLNILSVGSAREAARLLAATPDVAVVVLDVVMETDDAGLRLVRSVREVLGNAEVRIILVTGEPGMAPMRQSLGALDISDYWLKTDLTFERLHGVLTSNLRTWEQIRALGQARKGLQTIVEASNCLARARSMDDFSHRVMSELSRLLGLEPEGLVCVHEYGTGGHPEAARIVGAAGRLSYSISQELGTLEQAPVRDLLLQALAKRSSIDGPLSQVLFFQGAEHGPHAATYIATGRALDATERELLHVFATSINSGLINVSLTSRLDRLAYEDSLLEMPNANALLRALEAVLEAPAPRNRTVLFIELDQYSASCLSLGMEQGDLMLRRMAARLRKVFPAPAMVARLHGDTFAILGPTVLLHQSRLDELEALDLDDVQHSPYISVRAARVDLDVYTGSSRGAMAIGALLLRRAQMQKGAGVIEYQPALEQEANQRFNRSRDLYRALQCREISIELQPQVDLQSGRIIGAEALARWTRRDGSRIPPNEFIPMAEANGLIVPIGNQVQHMACQALQRLRDAGFPNIPIAVNVSPLQLARRNYLHELVEITQHYGVSPELLEVEITETAAMADFEGNGRVLRALRDAGFRIAIDDFGTGYSSLAHLRAMPATTLKIDRQFISEIGALSREDTIADMIIGLGKRLNMEVLAEGVESDVQTTWLREHACAQAQGYFFARPESLDSFLQRLARAT
jgi:EAL domain-containing protein (putative c-di-GMP-specific phosphodiesterase class I)/GGDEF domain-containing protein